MALDNSLLNKVVELSGEPTKTAAVTLALKEFVARREQRCISELLGTLEWASGFDHKPERSR